MIWDPEPSVAWRILRPNFVLARFAQGLPGDIYVATGSKFHSPCTRHLHGMNFESVHSGSDGWVAFAEQSSLLFIIHFEYAEPEGAATGHHRPEQKKRAGGKVLLKVACMLVH